MNRLFLFFLLSWFLQNPILALLIVAALSLPGYLYASGWMFRLLRHFRHWQEIQRLRETVAVNPHNVAAQTDLGRELAMTGRPQEALEHLRAAEPRSTDSAETLYFLGYSLLKCGDWEQGSHYVERALEIDPKFRYGEPYLCLGDYHFERRQFAEALPYYETFRSIHTSSAEGLYKLGRCYQELDRSAEAREALTAAVEAFQTAPRYKRREDRPWYRRAKRLFRRLPKGGDRQR
ncbi:MAG: tetratricopeptide repeat protein [Candidatus Methylomirabilales bacterium]